MDKQQLQQLITLFLAINPNPSDEQFHALAFSISVDHQTLEAISYQMLAEDAPGQKPQVQAGNPPPSETKLSEQQKVLDGDYDPNTTSPDNLLLNDGAPEGTSDIEQMQDAEYDDGVGADDIGVDVNGDKNANISDGLPPVQLNASSRLMEA
jgi:hypothetical protein